MPRAKTAKIRSMWIDPHLQVTPSERYSKLNQLMLRSNANIAAKSTANAKMIGLQRGTSTQKHNRVKSAFRNYQPQVTHMYDTKKRNLLLKNKQKEDSYSALKLSG